MSAGRLGPTIVGRGMRVLIILVLAFVLTATGGAALDAPRTAQASAREAGAAARPAVVCGSSAAIPAGALTHGLSVGCSLTGRTVVDGSVAVEVPPPGITVAADGMGRRGESPSLVVSNRGGVVFAGAAAASVSTATAGTPADCRSSAYNLENGRHPWRTVVRWHLRNRSVPKRMKVTSVAAHLRSAFGAWRYDRNDCGLGGKPKRLRDSYVGWTKHPTGIGVRHGSLKCGGFNRTNVVELGTLPGDLLGWTCYWWGNSGSMIAFDTRIETSDVVLTLPKGCRNRWDLQSVATHEFGHAIGLAHVSTASQTMHGVAPSCSTGPRLLGRGDRLGLKNLYGLR